MNVEMFESRGGGVNSRPLTQGKDLSYMFLGLSRNSKLDCSSFDLSLLHGWSRGDNGGRAIRFSWPTMPSAGLQKVWQEMAVGLR
jgi:hypothetical protein